MINIQDRNVTPSLGEIAEYIRNPLFQNLCAQMDSSYNASSRIEFSGCGWKPGWNVKFKKSGRTLCTVYPQENYFTVLVVVGSRECEIVEHMLPDMCSQIQEIYAQTKEGMGQRWLMIDLEDDGSVYENVLTLIGIRGDKKIK